MASDIEFQAFLDCCVCRQDFFWEYDEKGVPKMSKNILSNEKIQKHLAGELTLGMSPFLDSENVGFLGIDIDIHVSNATKKEMLAMFGADETSGKQYLNAELEKKKLVANSQIKKISNYLRENGYLFFINSSGSDGRHIRIFSSEKINAKMGRMFLNYVFDVIGLKDLPEVFPKQDKLSEETPYGNQMKGVLAVHPKTGRRAVILNDDFSEKTVSESLQFLVEFRQKIENAKPIIFDITPELEIKFGKKTLTSEEKQNLPKQPVPTFCPFVEDVACKTELPSGTATRHDFLDGNVFQYAKKNNKPEILEEYSEIQGRDRTAYNKCENWDWNCHTIRNYLSLNGNDEKIKTCAQVCADCDVMAENFADKYFHDRKFVPKRLGDEILNDYIFRTTTDDEQIYIYTDGLYCPIGESLIKKEVDRRLGEKTGSHRRMETINYIKVATYCEKTDFNSDKNIINLENCLLHIDTMEFEKHSPKVLNTIRIPVSYDENAECPLVKKFLSEILKADEIPVVEEFFGYCLLNGYPIHKAFMLIGCGANGKSTLLNLLKTFLGVKNTTSISMQELENNKYATSYIYGKLANIYPDLSAKALSWTGKFKMLTGGDLIGAESKFGKHFDFENTAKMIFSTNRIPLANDDSDAFYRRWIILNFYNIFDDENKNKDENLLEKLTTKQEISGLLNLALSGLKRLRENGKFSYSKTTEQIREHYIRMSDTIASFCMDCLEQSSDDFVVKKELYVKYCEYCRNDNLPILSDNTFHKNIVQSIKVEDYQTKSGGKRVRAWKGVKLTHLTHVTQAFSTLKANFLINKNKEKEEERESKEEEGKKPVLGVLPVSKLDTSPSKLCHHCQKPANFIIKHIQILSEPKTTKNGATNHDFSEPSPVCLDCLKIHLKSIFQLLGERVSSSEFRQYGISDIQIENLKKSGFWFEPKPDELMLC